MNKKGIKEIVLMQEEYVLIKSEKFLTWSHIYLDHDSEDSTISDFLEKPAQTQVKLQRSFMDDIYGILDVVELGLGRAVVSKYLLKDRKFQIVPGYKKYTQPVVLQYYERPYFSRLFKEIFNQLH